MLSKLDNNTKCVIICVWFAAIVNLISVSINQFAIYIVLPLAFILTFSNCQQLNINKYYNLLVGLYMWIVLSITWATDTSIAIRQVRQIIGSFILSYIFAVKAKNIKNIPWLYVTYFLIIIGDWHYAFNSIIINMDIGEERMNDARLNANSFAYHTFYVTFASYILGDVVVKRKYKVLLKIIFILTIPLSFYTAIYTASRQVLIIQIPIILVLLYIRYIKNSTLEKKILYIFIFLICFVLFIPKTLDIYHDSLLYSRNKLAVEDDTRMKLALDAIDVGFQYFPLGVGAGNYIKHSYNEQFSHNTYTELFANNGIIGLILYLSNVFIFIKRQWKRYKHYHDKLYLSFFIFGFFFIIDGIFYSFYEHLWLIGFYILVASHSESYYHERLKFINNN